MDMTLERLLLITQTLVSLASLFVSLYVAHKVQVINKVMANKIELRNDVSGNTIVKGKGNIVADNSQVNVQEVGDVDF